jgi:hypothetical protein
LQAGQFLDQSEVRPPLEPQRPTGHLGASTYQHDHGQGFSAPHARYDDPGSHDSSVAGPPPQSDPVAGKARLASIRMSRDESVIGKLGTVVHPIRPGKPGEVVVHIRGGTETYMAYSDTDLPEQAEVVVIGQRSARTVEVTPFNC